MEQRFEHRAEYVAAGRSLETVLKEVQQDGWELVAVVGYSGSLARELFFKRPYVSPEPEPPLSRHELDCQHFCHD